MIGNRYWATGMALTPAGSGRGDFEWGLRVDFYDDGFCDTDSTEGTLRVRYVVTNVVGAARLLKADAERLGIEFRIGPVTADVCVYVEGDGEREDLDYPADWREVAAATADALGFECPYQEPPR